MSGLYPREVIERVRESVDIVDLISSYIPLKKSGSNYSALCPFHTEKSPSFSVSPTKQFYHCFGCGEGGNAISFVMKYENMQFADALQLLATRGGITLPQRKGDSPEYSRLYEINMAATDFYRTQMKSAPAPVAAYVEKRRLSPGTVEKFRIGYAPDSWDACLKHLVSRKFSPDEVEKAGLVKKSSSGNLIDRFRNRLIFPIFDEHSRVIAFGGRTMAADDSGPKYLNSPETLVYAKGRVLYGLNWAAAKIRSGNSVMIVEGYMDLIALHQAGIENAVASSGTAFTESQCKTLKRYTPNIVMIFDGDEAGRRAAARATEIAAGQGIRPSVAMLPPGVDPDELIKTGGAAAFMEIVKEARPYMSYLIEQACRKHDMETAEGRADAARSMLPELAKIHDPIERSSYVEALAQKTSIPSGKIEARLRSTSPRYADEEQKTVRQAGAPQPKAPKKIKPSSPSEKWIMRIILDHPETLENKLAGLTSADFQTQAYGKMLEHVRQKLAEGPCDTNGLMDSMEDAELGPIMRSLVMESGVYEEESREKLVDDFLTSLRGRTRPAALEMAKTAAEKGQREEYLHQQENLRKL